MLTANLAVRGIGQLSSRVIGQLKNDNPAEAELLVNHPITQLPDYPI